MSDKKDEDLKLRGVQQSHVQSPAKDPCLTENGSFLLEFRVRRAQELNDVFKNFNRNFQDAHSDLISLKTTNDKLLNQIDEIRKQCFHREEVKSALQAQLDAVVTNCETEFI